MSNGFPEWWKHGQKVRTRRDGILTLNVAPDAEYWLTNDEGKEVYVFSADILGPVKNDAEGGRPMSNIDKRALREAADAANKSSWGRWESYHPHKGARGYEVKVGVKAVAQHCLKVDSVFIAAANPATVLGLLDELEAVQTVSAARLVAIDTTHKMFQRERDRAEKAEKRIAELEAREVVLPQRYSMLHRVDFDEPYHTEMVYKQHQVLEALHDAGVNVAAAAGKGEAS